MKRARTANRPRTAQLPKTLRRKRKTSPHFSKQPLRSQTRLLSSSNFPCNRPVSVNCILGESGRATQAKNFLHNPRPQTSYCARYKKTLDGRHMSLYTSKENEKIKRKMEEYVRVSRNCKEKSAAAGVTYDQLKQRFDYFAMKIDSMLAREVSIESIRIHENYRVHIGTNTKKQFKLWAKMKSIPLRMKVTMERGVGKLMFSQENSRPSLENYDKLVPLLGKDLIESYVPNKEIENRFVEDNVYMTIEADKETALTFQCVFGNGKHLADSSSFQGSREGGGDRTEAAQ